MRWWCREMPLDCLGSCCCCGGGGGARAGRLRGTERGRQAGERSLPCGIVCDTQTSAVTSSLPYIYIVVVHDTHAMFVPPGTTRGLSARRLPRLASLAPRSSSPQRCIRGTTATTQRWSRCARVRARVRPFCYESAYRQACCVWCTNYREHALWRLRAALCPRCPCCRSRVPAPCTHPLWSSPAGSRKKIHTPARKEFWSWHAPLLLLTAGLT